MIKNQNQNQDQDQDRDQDQNQDQNQNQRIGINQSITDFAAVKLIIYRGIIWCGLSCQVNIDIAFVCVESNTTM